MDDEVTLEELPEERRPLLDALLQLYLHDFSEHAALDGPHGEVDEAGRFSYADPDACWRDPERVPLLIRHAGRVAGFVLVNARSALGRPLDHAVAEFFVLRKFRLARVGTRAALLLFARWPGRWEVPVASYNQEAILFWRSVARALPVPVEERRGDGVRPGGPVLAFVT